MIVADLPGSYSLSAGSDEEIITLDYIASGNADLALVMADASQLKRSLYMLADFVGMQVPAILVLNMMDVAKGQGITIDTEALSRKLGIPVVPMSAIRKKDYRTLYETIEAALAQKPVITGQAMESAKEKTDYIDGLLNGVLTADKTAKQAFSKFDRLALSPVRGKLLAFGIILLIFLLSMIFSGVVSGIASAVLTPLSDVLRSGMEQIHVHGLLISLICDVLINVLFFALMMASFVLGITLGFNLMEETGYLARLSFLFDRTMSKVGLQGKAIMPFFMGLGCTIAGTTGTRVVDNWGQRVLAIAMSWAVPCSATLSVVPTIAITLFSSTSGFLAMVSIFLFMFLMMWIVYRVFGKSLAPKEERVGLIMELPPSTSRLVNSCSARYFIKALRSSLPSCSGNFIISTFFKSCSELRLVSEGFSPTATIVRASPFKILEFTGRLHLLSSTILTGFLPSTIRVVSSQSSCSTVFLPTITASCVLRR